MFLSSLLLAILLLVSFSVLASPNRVAAACGDLSQEYDTRQYFAPLTVEADFLQTPNRGGDWTSSSLSASNSGPRTAQVVIGNDFLRFEAYGNDTYTFWFAGFYATDTPQNVTLIITEGDRTPAKEYFCMGGTNFSFKWTDLTVVNEPHPLSQSEVAGAIYPEVNQGQQATQKALAANTQVLWWVFLENVGILILLAILSWAVYRLGNKFHYG